MSRMLSIAALALAMLATSARAEIKDLLPRLPAAANAIVAVDVTSVLNSPVGKAQQWGTTEGALPVVRLGATKALLATKVNLGNMDSNWEVGVFELNKQPSMAGIALSEGGMNDTLADLPTAWSSRKIYFLALDKQLLGVVAPDDRQFAVRWARQQAGDSKPLIAPFLQEAALQANSKSPVIMALDLQDAISLNKVRKALITDLSRATLIKDTSADAVAQLLTTLKGIIVRIHFANEITADVVLPFGKDPSIIQGIAVPLLKDFMVGNGLALDDIDSWTVSKEDNNLVCSGKLSLPSFQKVMSLVEVPSPASVDAPSAAASATPPAGTPPAAPPVASDPRAATIAASQKYYKAVSVILDSFSQPASAGAGAAWLKRACNRIDHLPMVNVDPELIQWGNSVSASLLAGAQQLATGQTQITAKAAGAYGANVVTPAAYYQDSNGDYQYNRDAQARADYARQTAAMAQATQEERARVTAPVAQLLSQTIATRARMRATLVERYGVEF